MNIRALETLVQLLVQPSFSAVAEARNMTLSAVSMQMKALEKELNAALFDRQSRPPRLTPLGRKVAEQARLVLAERDDLQALCQSNQGLTGQFLIGFIQTASVRVLPHFLANARAQTPQATFQFAAGLSETLSDDVAEGRLDAAVVTQVEREVAQLRFQPLATEAMVMALPASHAGLDRDALSATLPLIRFRPSSGIGRLISTSLAKAGHVPEQQLILDSIEGTLECVKLGLGYTLLPEPDVARYADSRIVTRAVPGDDPGRDLVLVTRDDKTSAKWRDEVFALMKLG